MLRTAIAGFRKQHPTMSSEEREKTAALMLSFIGTDTPIEAEMQDELIAEAFKTWPTRK
jgi:hypothetical protein